MSQRADPSVVAIVLAAGLSRRFGRANKLLAEIDGVPLIRRVVERVLASGIGRVLVVTGHERGEITAALSGLPLLFVHNPDYQQGMGTSVAAGIRSLGPDVDGALVLLGDMPETEPESILRLLAAFATSGGHRVVFPMDHRGRQANPVLWPRDLFHELAALEGDKGGRALIEAHAKLALGVPEENIAAVTLDIDTPEALDRWRRAKGAGPDRQ